MKVGILNDKKPIVINRELAKLVGINESIILQQIHYWTQEINKAKGEKSVNYQEGYYWTFNSYEEWQKQFPFWSVSTIKRTIKKLENRKLIVADNYNKMKVDRTKWYRIDYKNLDELCHFAKGQNDQFKWSEWADHLSKLNKPITRDYLSEITNRENNMGRKNSCRYSFYSDKTQKHLKTYKSNNYICENVSYYLKIYKQKNGKNHSKLKLSQWDKVFNNIILKYDKKTGKEFELIGDIFKDVVKQHFKTNYTKNIDYNILHFITGDIIKNRAFEAGYR